MKILSSLLPMYIHFLMNVGLIKFLSQRPLTWNLNVFCDSRLNKRLCKQAICCWFETSSHTLWRHFNVRRKYSQFVLARRKHITTHFNQPLFRIQLTSSLRIYVWIRQEPFHNQPSLPCILFFFSPVRYQVVTWATDHLAYIRIRVAWSQMCQSCICWIGLKKYKQGKPEGFDRCDRPNNL